MRCPILKRAFREYLFVLFITHITIFQLLLFSCRIFVDIQESVQGPSRGYMKLHLRGLDIKNVEPGLLGLGRSDPFFEISKKNSDHASGVVRW